MNSHLALLVLLFTFETSNSVRFVFEVENAYFNKNPIKLQVVAGSGEFFGEEQEVQYRKNLTWEDAMVRSYETLAYQCRVTVLEKSDGANTYVGSFEVFNSTWVKGKFSRLRRKRKITVLWHVFDKGARTRLVPEMGGRVLYHRWRLLEFAVYNEFDEMVKLSALDEINGLTVKNGEVPKGEALRWSRYVTSTEHFKYKIKAMKFVTETQTQPVGTAEIFDSESVRSERLEEVGSMAFWWGVDNSGIRKFNPSTGQYFKKKIITWGSE